MKDHLGCHPQRRTAKRQRVPRQHPREAEVEKLETVERGGTGRRLGHDVAGLQVSVDDGRAARVEVAQGAAQVDHRPQPVVHRQRLVVQVALLHDVLERYAVHPLEHEGHVLVDDVHTRAVQKDDVGMAHSPQDPRLVEEGHDLGLAVSCGAAPRENSALHGHGRAVEFPPDYGPVRARAELLIADGHLAAVHGPLLAAAQRHDPAQHTDGGRPVVDAAEGLSGEGGLRAEVRVRGRHLRLLLVQRAQDRAVELLLQLRDAQLAAGEPAGLQDVPGEVLPLEALERAPPEGRAGEEDEVVQPGDPPVEMTCHGGSGQEGRRRMQTSQEQLEGEEADPSNWKQQVARKHHACKREDEVRIIEDILGIPRSHWVIKLWEPCHGEGHQDDGDDRDPFSGVGVHAVQDASHHRSTA
mmetsp:Transcript_69922/g.208364  ORF Transcript_69922/g.208364 Transcript_69922/m.208364 type:complete len:412 (+) Transcript_69922:936-2171(+)